MKRNVLKTIMAAMVMLVLSAGSASAVPIGQLGILDDTANGGINPATGVAWANGDTYRLIFASSVGRDATSSDINDYNAFIQNVADAAGLGGATWTALASTDAVDARDNTNTNINVDGAGEPILLMNGTEVIADDYADFYGGRANGENIDISETGGTPFDGGDFTSVWTGSAGDGTQKFSPGVFGGNNALGSSQGADADPNTPTSQTGLWGTGSAAQWIDRFNIDQTDIKGLYGISEVLTIGGGGNGVPEPATATLAMLGLGGLVMRRRRKLA